MTSLTSFARKPTVFISSTCYDLKQIRSDLKKVIENDLGFEVLLSEYSSFGMATVFLTNFIRCRTS
ncbi:MULTISPECIES: DUF4062 domain-containing protein, partial [unclassified Enterococcus]|uniref:DUF4062 domain-containing protein n=1 Tax=unclassified Enterococcus TaxID=2608891 RepID=UPI00190525A9